jgi:flagellar hook-basal body complex protein FliE
MVAIDQIGSALAGAVRPQVQQQQPAQPFGGIFRAMVDQTTSLDQKAQQAVTGLLNGSGVDVHEAMIATQKSDMAFELALQVRNKAVGAYQQMMQMQF